MGVNPGGQGDTISNVPLNNFSRAFTTKLYTIFDGFILFSAIFVLIYTLHDASNTVSAKFSGHAHGVLTIA